MGTGTLLRALPHEMPVPTCFVLTGGEQMKMTLYHTGYQEIRTPDIHQGRKNADFGQGFYLSDDAEFSRRWAKERSGFSVYLNKYELETDKLKIKNLTRNEEWFTYIFANRSVQPDRFAEYDVIIGPIANDTLYDTLGITTSGFLTPEQATRTLLIGPLYSQIVLKTEKAAAALRFLSAEILKSEEIAKYRESLQQEEKQFQEQFAKLIEEMLGD